MAGRRATRDADMVALTILDMRDGQGMSFRDIAVRLKMSRNAVLGIAYRVDRASREDTCACRKPRNKDGGMPRRWWAS